MMTAKLLEGLPVAERVMMEVAGRAAGLREARMVAGLATVRVGDDPASVGYVRKKHEACAAVGVRCMDAEYQYGQREGNGGGNQR